jgi:nucleoid DNA-binding protein
MNKSDLIDALAGRAGLTLDRAGTAVNAVFEQMVDAMKRGDRVEVRNFGNFAVKNLNGYIGANPKTREAVRVEPKKRPCFKPGLGLKESLNSGKLKR